MMMDQTSIYSQKIQWLRQYMVRYKLAAYIVPRADEYQGEYCASYAARLEWLTGFTGSAGSAVILKDKAVVFTDARYTLQLRRQVEREIYKTADIADISIGGWLQKNLSEGDVGYDPRLLTPSQIERILQKFHGTLKPIDENLIDKIWDERPARPHSALAIFPQDIAGRGVQEKCTLIAKILQEKKCEAFILNTPDSICWLLNIRANDLEHTPVVLSSAIIQRSGRVIWFIEESRVGYDIHHAIGPDIEIIEPSKFEKRS